MTTALSIIICTHNPNPLYLNRLLDALKSQTLPCEDWELLLIDNASDKSVAEQFDINWHPRGRHIREDELGLTPARLRGIRDSKGEILVFVDDDNILDVDFLEKVAEIANEWSILGAWGGNIRPEFESIPEEWTKAFWVNLAIREFEQDYWSNNVDDWKSQPCGAGLCVRRSVAQRYLKETCYNQAKLLLGRKGNNLASCEDTDLVLTSLDFGLGFGVFQELRLTHIIPARRLEEDYLVELTKGIAISNCIMKYLRTKEYAVPKSSLWKTARYVYNIFAMSKREKKFYLAGRDAERIAYETILEIKKG